MRAYVLSSFLRGVCVSALGVQRVRALCWVSGVSRRKLGRSRKVYYNPNHTLNVP